MNVLSKFSKGVAQRMRHALLSQEGSVIEAIFNRAVPLTGDKPRY